MTTDKYRFVGSDAGDREAIEPVVKLLLVAGGLFLLWGMVTNLPGVDRVVPATGVSFGALLGGLVTLGIVGILGYLALHVEPPLVRVLGGPVDLAVEVAAMAKHAILFVAVLVAYNGLEGLVLPSLAAADLGWTYDLLFFVLALVPTLAIAVLMYRNYEEVASLVSSRLVSEDRGETPDSSS
jgi:hypothetical protein